MSAMSARFIATVLLLCGAMVASILADRRNPDFLAAPLEQIDSNIAGWHAVNREELDAGVLRALSPTSYLSRKYEKGHTQLNLFVAYYAQQRAGEAMHSPKHCLPGAGWEIWRQESEPVRVDGQEFHINKYSIQNSGERMLMFYWYQSKNRVVASEYLVKVVLLKDSLLTGHTAGSIVRIMLPDLPGATEEAVTFAARLIPELRHCFGA